MLSAVVLLLENGVFTFFRLVIKDSNTTRLNDSCETALKLSGGLLLVETQTARTGKDGEKEYETNEEFFSQNLQQVAYFPNDGGTIVYKIY